MHDWHTINLHFIWVAWKKYQKFTIITRLFEVPLKYEFRWLTRFAIGFFIHRQFRFSTFIPMRPIPSISHGFQNKSFGRFFQIVGPSDFSEKFNQFGGWIETYDSYFRDPIVHWKYVVVVVPAFTVS